MPGHLQHIAFSSNWNNNKLLGDVFWTFRLANHTKFKLGNKYIVRLNSHILGAAKLIKIKAFAYPVNEGSPSTNIDGILHYHINESHALVDIGKPLPYLLSLLNKFYPTANWSTQPIWWLFFEYLDTSDHHQKIKKVRVEKNMAQAELFEDQLMNESDFATKLMEI